MNISKAVCMLVGAIIGAAIVGISSDDFGGALIGGLIGAIVGVCVVVVFSRNAEEVVSELQSAVTQPRRDNPETIVEGLIRLNQEVRLTFGVPERVTTAVESVIDGLIRLVPDMMDQFPNEELTYELKRGADKHLPELIVPYLRLSPEGMAEQETNIVERLNGMMSEVVGEVSDLLDRGLQAEFERKAKALKLKYA